GCRGYDVRRRAAASGNGAWSLPREIIRTHASGRPPMLTWGTAYVISEWLVRIVMLVYVPQRRSPASARAWLLLIFFLPALGLVLYALIGRAYIPRRRLAKQARVMELLQAMPKAPAGAEQVAAQL